MSEPGEMGVVTVRFQLHPDESGWPAVDVEEIGATHAGGDHYRLTGSPLYAWGVARGDVVEALADSDGLLWATSVVEHSGHLSLRVLPEAEGTLDTDAAVGSFAALRVEGRAARDHAVVALDVPPEADLEAVKRLLADGERDGRWSIHEALVSDEWRALP